MADTREITTVFRADVSQFNAATQQLNRNVAQVNSEFKVATASMSRWNDNTDGLRAKLTQLNGVLDAEKQRLALLEAQYAELVKQGKENTVEAQNLATAINNQEAKVKETEKGIEHYTESLNELETAGVETKEELEELNKSLEEQKQAASDLGGGVLKGAALGVAGFAAACAGALSTLSSIVEETKELRTQMGMLETTFTQQGHSVEAAKKTYDDLFSVLGDSGKATEASQQLAQIAKNEQELEQMTNTLTGVYATFGDSLPVEALAEAMNATANIGSVQGNLADALEWSGVNLDTFNEQLAGLNTEEERAALISSTLNGLYGETATKYKEVNKDVIAANKAQNEYNQAMAEIGEKAQPAITSFKTAMVEVLQTIMAKFSEADIEGLIGGITNAITWLTTTALPPVMTALTWVLDNLNWLAPLLGGLVGTITAISAGIKIYNGVMAIAKVVQLAWNAALAANPIGLVITAVGLLVGAFVVLWNECEGFRNFFIGLWDTIKKVGAGAADSIGKTFTSVMGTAKGAINGIISLINGAIGAINKISIDIPDWVPEFGGRTIGFNIPKIPKLAYGGIVDKPTLAMVGEAGKEAVMPLENNTGWIDQLAEKIGAKVGASNINYTINNKFERMETSRYALHQANLETKRILKGGY